MTVLATTTGAGKRAPGFEHFLERVRALAAAQPGNQGMTVIAPPGGSSEYAIIYRFATKEHPRRWQCSPERATLIAGSAELAETAPVQRELGGL